MLHEANIKAHSPQLHISQLVQQLLSIACDLPALNVCRSGSRCWKHAIGCSSMIQLAGDPHHQLGPCPASRLASTNSVRLHSSRVPRLSAALLLAISPQLPSSTHSPIISLSFWLEARGMRRPRLLIRPRLHSPCRVCRLPVVPGDLHAYISLCQSGRAGMIVVLQPQCTRPEPGRQHQKQGVLTDFPCRMDSPLGQGRYCPLDPLWRPVVL